ncbi:hypothetical protein EI94DRAFT_1665241 [Lactarius quietus]|nr:hypothetical protein EI94DRAFT_1665241 [Lactarius quietus]
MQQQSKHFSFRKTFQNVFHVSEKGVQSSSDTGDPVSSGTIGGGSDLAMGVIETSLAALQTGSALITNVPFISPVAGLILQALKMRGEVKQYKEQWGAVMEKLAGVGSIVINVGEACQTRGLAEEDLPDSLRAILKSLQSDLEGIEDALKQCAETTRSPIKRVLLRVDILQKVMTYDAKLSIVLHTFHAKLTLDARFDHIVEKRELNSMTQPEATMSTTLGQGPTKPQIFFGRETELAQIVHMITTNIGSRPARIAILGPGGYGKTTLAHAVLTVDTIREHFGDARYFVPCESVTSSGALMTELGKTLGIVKGGSDALWSRIHAMLASKDSIICFDNFESPWDQDVETKHSVEELLSRITELHHVTVLITMRGAERPARTQWTHPFLKPLETLDHDAAKEIWQAVAENYDNFAEKLIEAVDYVPLAVDLLSHLSQVTPPVLLWREWNSKQIKSVQTGQEHRLSNLEHSIQLFIDSGRMKANSSAKNLLGVLCMLSDGLHLDHLNKFDDMLVGLDITSCLQTLLQCSLIKLNEDRYQPHPIVRHFCLHQDMLLLKHKATIEGFYIALASSKYEKVPSNAYGEMVLEVNNTKAMLLSLLNSNYKDECTLINASIEFTRFCISIGDHSDKVISQAVKFIQKNSCLRPLLIRSLEQWGSLYYHAYNWEKAKEKLKEAEKLCLSSQNVSSTIYGTILTALGDLYEKQGILNDAEACYQKALGLFKYDNSILNQGNLFSRLGNLYRRSWKLDEAISQFQSAIQCHKNVNATLSLGGDYKGLGWTYLSQGKVIEAESAVLEALKFHEAVNSLLQQGNDYDILGRVYFELKKLEDATSACQKALEFHKMTNHTLGQGHDHGLFGRIYFSQGKLNEAESSFKKALELHSMAKSVWGQGIDCSYLGRIYMERGQLYDAKDLLKRAIDLAKKAQNSVGEKEYTKYLNAVMTQIKESGVV